MAGVRSDEKGAAKKVALDETPPGSAQDAPFLGTEKLPKTDAPVPEDIGKKSVNALENLLGETAISRSLPEQAALDSTTDLISVEFSVATQSEGMEATIMLEAPAGFDPANPDFDLFFEDVLAETVKLQENFPHEITNTDPITGITGAKVTLPDGTMFSQPAPFASDDVEYLFITETLDETLPEAEDGTDEDAFELI